MPAAAHPRFTYVLPLRSEVSLLDTDLHDYVRWLSTQCEVVVVDGSPAHVFDAHASAWRQVVTHVAPDMTTAMGKVGGVLTGVRVASHDKLIIADDDVRYDAKGLVAMLRHLDEAEVVRPQNYFSPVPWHACWDTGRSLLNRMSGGDWPGTLGVRRSVLRRTGGYDGNAMFENLELVRTVVAAGGREIAPLDLYVARRPSTARHFLSQRIRQAYDELARPGRLAVQLAVLPAAALLVSRKGWPALFFAAAGVAGIAEIGRRRAGGAKYFPAAASLCAPAWVAERAVCSWLAVGSRILFGGVRYHGRVLGHAATPLRVLRALHGPARSIPEPESPRRSA